MNFVTFRRSALTLLCAMAVLMAVAPDANAQDPRRGYNVGVAAQGTDMWTQAMAGLRLFTPHRNDCDDTTTPTEAFVKVYTNSNNVDFGYCIDLEEHSAGAIDWEDARQECLDDGKRLPEHAEYKFACQQSITGLNDMTDDYEWSSNFSYILGKQDHHNINNMGVITSVTGGGSCIKTVRAYVSRSDNTSSKYFFRCVR